MICPAAPQSGTATSFLMRSLSLDVAASSAIFTCDMIEWSTGDPDPAKIYPYSKFVSILDDTNGKALSQAIRK